MTDQTTPNTTDKDRSLDRAARVIHKALDRIWGYDAPEWADAIAADLDLAGLLAPAPPRPTLADMTDDEREACRRMQCDVRGRKTSGVIVSLYCRAGRARVLWPDGFVGEIDLERVTPRPDLPRLEWPGDTSTGPDHLSVGTIIESADDPRLGALPDGSILLDRDDDSVTKRDGAWSGNGYVPNEPEGAEFGPWTVLHIPKEADQ